MEIQLINYSGTNDKGYAVAECTSFGNAMSLDMYDLNIIDLSDRYIWIDYLTERYGDYGYCQDDSGKYPFNKLNISKDFLSIQQRIKDSNTKILYLLPRNIYAGINLDYDLKRTTLKDELIDFKVFLDNLIVGIRFTIKFDRTETTVRGEIFGADFCIEYYGDSERKIYSDKSQKLVSVSDERYNLTTLHIENGEALTRYLEEIYSDKSEEDYPEWFDAISFFDDTVQKDTIKTEEERICEAKQKIEAAQKRLQENKHYESILFRTGPKLEEILIAMLQEIFGVKEEFKDLKKEDYLFIKNNIHYIFEFKGLTKDIKNSNIAQLRTHGYKYLENNKIDDSQLRQIIIVTRFKDVNPAERNPVSHNVIEVAENPQLKVLIIDSIQFLKLFEKHRAGEIGTEDCLKLFEQVGLLEDNQI